MGFKVGLTGSGGRERDERRPAAPRRSAAAAGGGCAAAAGSRWRLTEGRSVCWNGRKEEEGGGWDGRTV